MYRSLFALLLCLCDVFTATGFAAVTLRHFWWEPRVINSTGNQPATFHVLIDGTPTSVVLIRPNGSNMPLAKGSGGEYTLSLTHSQIMDGYVADDVHNLVGFLEIYEGATRVIRLNVFVCLRTPSMPDAIVQTLGPDIQYSNHVVNIRSDTIVTPQIPQDPVKRLYQFFPDQFDFLAVVQQRDASQNRFYKGLRNDTQGIGLTQMDNGASWGSRAALQGIVCYPIDNYYDLGESAACHEIGHRWINFLKLPILSSGSPHWPMSDIASHSLMGFNIPGSSQGGAFPWSFTPIGGDQYRLDPIPKAQVFNDLDLYLMGLIPPAEVQDHWVFQNQNQNPSSGGILNGPLVKVTIADIIGSSGPRVPNWDAAPKHFRIGTIVLSYQRLLTADEMTFFDFMAARGELRSTLPYSSGLARGIAKPFYLATGGRASWSTQTSNISYTPHFGYGMGLSTTFVAVNPSSTLSIKGRVVPSDSNGDLMPVATGSPGWIHQLDLELPPLGTRFLSTPGTGTLQVGSAAFHSHGRLAGTTIFGGSFGMAGVAASSPAESFVIPFWTDSASGVNVGAALVNPYAVEVSYMITVRRKDGALVSNGQVTASLPPYGQIARFPQELFAGKNIDFSDFSGTLHVEGSMPLGGMALVQTSQELATLPVVPAEKGATVLTFPHFGDGTGIVSSIVLVNPSNSKALHGTAQIRDKTGASWGLRLNGVWYSGSVSFEIPPAGMERLISEGKGDLVVGSVRVSANGPIAGTVLFQASSGMAGFGSSELSTRALIPVDTLRAVGLSIGVAIHNPNPSPVVVTYRLRDQNALLVPNGQQSASIAANGQLARFLEEIFEGKGIDFSNFKGSCEVLAGAPVAAIAVRSGSAQLAAFPVVAVD